MKNATQDLGDGPVTKPRREPIEKPEPRPKGPAGGGTTTPPPTPRPTPRPLPPQPPIDDPIDGPVTKPRKEPKLEPLPTTRCGPQWQGAGSRSARRGVRRRATSRSSVAVRRASPSTSAQPVRDHRLAPGRPARYSSTPPCSTPTRATAAHTARWVSQDGRAPTHDGTVAIRSSTAASSCGTRGTRRCLGLRRHRRGVRPRRRQCLRLPARRPGADRTGGHGCRSSASSPAAGPIDLLDARARCPPGVRRHPRRVAQLPRRGLARLPEDRRDGRRRRRPLAAVRGRRLHLASRHRRPRGARCDRRALPPARRLEVGLPDHRRDEGGRRRRSVEPLRGQPATTGRSSGPRTPAPCGLRADPPAVGSVGGSSRTWVTRGAARTPGPRVARHATAGVPEGTDALPGRPQPRRTRSDRPLPRLRQGHELQGWVRVRMHSDGRVEYTGTSGPPASPARASASRSR